VRHHQPLGHLSKGTDPVLTGTLYYSNAPDASPPVKVDRHPWPDRHSGYRFSFFKSTIFRQLFRQLARIQSTDNNGSLRIRFKFQGDIYNISGLGSSGDRIARARAELAAALIDRDIHIGAFDATLARYQPQKPATIAKPMKLLELWDLWVETLGLSQQTKSDHYATVRNMIFRSKPLPKSDSTDWFIQDGANLSAFSYNMRKRMIGNCLDWAIEQKLIETNPFRTIKSKKAAKRNKTRPLSLEQVRQILEGFKVNHPEYHKFSTFLFLTGCRISEAIGLQWKRVAFEAGTVTIADTLASVNYQKATVRQQTKTGSITVLAMSEGLRKLLESLPQGKPDDLVFHYEDGEPISLRKYYYRWVRLLKRLEIPHVKSYVSRHTFTSHALATGLDSSKVAQFLGHTDSSMVDRNYGSTMSTPKLPDLNL
jgi:integrase